MAKKKEVKDLKGVTIDGVQWFPQIAKTMKEDDFIKAHKEAYRVKMSIGLKKGDKSLTDAKIEKKLKEIYSQL